MGILDLAPPGFLFVGSLGGEFFVLPLIPLGADHAVLAASRRVKRGGGPLSLSPGRPVGPSLLSPRIACCFLDQLAPFRALACSRVREVSCGENSLL